LAAKVRAASSVRIDIADSGQGIKDADIARIFDPFFTTKSQGTGLGLTVSHGIIYEQGGVVDVDSRLGQGTTFHITFPLLESPSGKEPTP
jgi:signal transduction histidine kinase